MAMRTHAAPRSSLPNELRNWMNNTRAEITQQLADQAQRIESIARKRAADDTDASSADDESSDGDGTSRRKKSKRKKKSKPKPWYERKEKTEMQEQMLVKARVRIPVRWRQRRLMDNGQGEVKTTFASFIFLRTSKYEDEADSEGVLPDQNESKKRFDIWESWRKLPRPGEKRVDRAGNVAHKVDFEDTAKAAVNAKLGSAVATSVLATLKVCDIPSWTLPHPDVLRRNTASARRSTGSRLVTPNPT